MARYMVDGGGQGGASLLLLADRGIQRAEAPVAVGLERAHTQCLSQGEGLDGLLEVAHCFAECGAVPGPRTGLLTVGHGLVPHRAPHGMMRQAVDLLGPPVGCGRLEGIDNARVEPPPPLQQEATNLPSPTTTTSNTPSMPESTRCSWPLHQVPTRPNCSPYFLNTESSPTHVYCQRLRVAALALAACCAWRRPVRGAPALCGGAALWLSRVVSPVVWWGT